MRKSLCYSLWLCSMFGRRESVWRQLLEIGYTAANVTCHIGFFSKKEEEKKLKKNRKTGERCREKKIISNFIYSVGSFRQSIYVRQTIPFISNAVVGNWMCQTTFQPRRNLLLPLHLWSVNHPGWFENVLVHTWPRHKSKNNETFADPVHWMIFGVGCAIKQ